MVVGGYTLHLYCDGSKCDKTNSDGSTRVGEFFSWNNRQARIEAKKAGWSFKRDRNTLDETCYCKECSK